MLVDQVSRACIGFAVFHAPPTSNQIQLFLERAIRASRHTPRYLVTDRGCQFDCRSFKRWCKRQEMRLRFGVLGEPARVQKIGRITKVVACDVDVEREIVTPIDPSTVLTPEESRRIVGVTQAAAERRGWSLQRDHQFFLCDRLEDTAFCKNSPGGIQSHRYFDLADYLKGSVPTDIADLGKALRDVTWK